MPSAVNTPPPASTSLGMFNPAPPSKTTGTFVHFNRLPTELRWIIWKVKLQHQRLLHVEVKSPEPCSTNTHRALNEHEASSAYEIILSEYQPFTKLARVNLEARSIASHFYRVQLPCVYLLEGKKDGNGILYFHPELDTLEIRCQHFVNFAQDL